MTYQQGFTGMDVLVEPDRIREDRVAMLRNGVADASGALVKLFGTSPITMNNPFSGSGFAGVKVHSLHDFQRKNGTHRVASIIGSSLYVGDFQSQTAPNQTAVLFRSGETPALARPAAMAMADVMGWHQNGVDRPFFFQMDTDEADVLGGYAVMAGLEQPSYCFDKVIGGGAGALFPAASVTGYAVTFVCGSDVNGSAVNPIFLRGESGPCPVAMVKTAADTLSLQLSGIPLGGSSDNGSGAPGVIARRIYRTRIGQGAFPSAPDPRLLDIPPIPEMFFLAELHDNTSTSYVDTTADPGLDFARRMPPPRGMPPIARYQVRHNARFLWANLADNPAVARIASTKRYSNGGTDTAITAATITISNTGNGTITLTATGTGTTPTITVSSYKTKTLRAIQAEINVRWQGFTLAANNSTVAGPPAASSDGFVFRITPGIDPDKKYTFTAVTSQNILGDENAWMIIATAGTRTRPRGVAFSDVTFPEQWSPLNQFEVGTVDDTRVTGLLHTDYGVFVTTEDAIFNLAGSFITGELGVVDVSAVRTRAGAGNICLRPDAMLSGPDGILFVAHDGLRRFNGETSVLDSPEVTPLFQRIFDDPATRENLCMSYFQGVERIALAPAWPGVFEYV